MPSASPGNVLPASVLDTVRLVISAKRAEEMLAGVG
jgi:hypothetical protein